MPHLDVPVHIGQLPESDGVDLTLRPCRRGNDASACVMRSGRAQGAPATPHEWNCLDGGHSSCCIGRLCPPPLPSAAHQPRQRHPCRPGCTLTMKQLAGWAQVPDLGRLRLDRQELKPLLMGATWMCSWWRLRALTLFSTCVRTHNSAKSACLPHRRPRATRAAGGQLGRHPPWTAGWQPRAHGRGPD